MGGCVSSHQDANNNAKYVPRRTNSALAREAAAKQSGEATDDKYKITVDRTSEADVSRPPSSEGKHTTENTFATAMLVVAKNVQAFVLHGINSDANQFQEEISRTDALCSGLNPNTKKFIGVWADDHLQWCLRYYLLSKLPAISGGDVVAWSPNGKGTFIGKQVSTSSPGATPTQMPRLPTLADMSSHPCAVIDDDEDEAVSPTQQAIGTPSNESQGTVPLREKAPRPANLTIAITNPNSSSSTLPAHALGATPVGFAEEMDLFTCHGVTMPSLARHLDLDLLIRIINDYCDKGLGMRSSGGANAGTMTPKKNVNRRGKVVTLGDTIGMLLHRDAEVDPSTRVCQEYEELTQHLRPLERAPMSTLANNSLHSFPEGSGVAPGGSVFSGNFSEGASVSHLDDSSGDLGDLLSPLSTGLGGLSPYAAHTNPWKERPLNMETIKAHNKINLYNEKQLTDTEKAIERRPKVLMQLIFGPAILAAFCSKSA